MENIIIVLADADEKYLMPLERKFIDEFEYKAEINVITDVDYLNTFFAAPQRLDILVIDEKLYTKDFDKHDINNIFVLSERPEDVQSTVNWNVTYINKYTSVKEIFSEVMENITTNMMGCLPDKDESTVIMVYSPIGGIGKTSIAAGLCGALAQKHKKVLFIGTDTLQTFGYLINNESVLKSGMERLLLSCSENIYDEIRPYIFNGLFSVLPPFVRALSSLNITGADYLYLIEKIKNSKDYDYIVVDSSSEFTEHTSKLMGSVNYTLLITGQDRCSVHKLSCLLENIDCSDSNRFLFVCNKYRSDSENTLVNADYLQKFRIKEYITYEEEIDFMDINQISGIKSIQGLAYAFI